MMTLTIVGAVISVMVNPSELESDAESAPLIVLATLAAAVASAAVIVAVTVMLPPLTLSAMSLADKPWPTCPARFALKVFCAALSKESIVLAMVNVVCTAKLAVAPGESGGGDGGSSRGCGQQPGSSVDGGQR